MELQRFLGVDAGGTFTDFFYLEIGNETRVQLHKTLSTPSAPEQAILDGIAALGLDKLPKGAVLHIIHGSTVATNAALEGKLAKTAFITNYGLGDMLSLARQTRPELYTLQFPPQQDPVPEALCLETGGRLGADGCVVEPLTDAELEKLIAELQILQPEAVAINLLFAFLDDGFEKRISEAIEAAGLPVFISRSSWVLPVYREYERGIATWLNAALGPVVHGYLSRLKAQLPDAALQIMQSNGETLPAEQAADSAVQLLLSGPAGGLTAMRYLGTQLGEDRIISFDMGGTSTDVALLSGELSITTEGQIDCYPVAVPMVDMHTIGAGGGSIARIDDGGMLQVGPQSAGAEPGPACYGRGGKLATVTDANAVLGRLLTSGTLANGLQLDKALAVEAIANLASQIGLSNEETALGIVRVANEHMAKAMRLISVNRGHDPQQFLLASFGGAGGLHVCEIAEAMQMRKAIVPVYGGVLSALGMLVANQGRQFTRTVSTLLPNTNSSLADSFAALEAQGRQQLLDEGSAPDLLQCKRSADIRYQGQSYTLNIAWQDAAQAAQDFAALHSQRYGYKLEVPVEVVNLRVNVFVPRELPGLPEYEQQTCNKAETTMVYGYDAPVSVFDRLTLTVGQTVSGPAIIREYAATTYVAADWQFQVDRLGNILLERCEPTRASGDASNRSGDFL